ncbi:MAG: cadherin domain-containing protein [Oleispira sp.]|nr:cadherin domain-containing protein [Oleispira sp.]
MLLRILYFVLITVSISSCGGGSTSDASINVNSPVSSVTDTDSRANTVIEVAGIGTSIGLTAHATDSDVGDIVNYSLSDSASGLFSVGTSTGVVTIAGPLDYEEKNQHSITVVATSSDGSFSSNVFDIDIVNYDPQVSLTFPPMNGQYQGSTIDVFGTFSEVESDLVINVDGGSTLIQAEIDLFNHSWRALNVPLVSDSSKNIQIVVTASDSSGEESILESHLTTNPPMSSPRSISLDSTNNRAFVVDPRIGQVLAIDLNTGLRSVISEIENSYAIVFDEEHNRILALDLSASALISIDVDSGNQTVVSSKDVGVGVNFVNPKGVDLDTINNRALVTNVNSSILISVDLTTGNRTEISGENIGNGPLWTAARSLVIDLDNDRVFIGDSTSSIYSVKLSTGERVVISNASTGTGVSLGTPNGIELDIANNRLWVASFSGVIIEVDIDTGDRQQLEGGIAFAEDGTNLQLSRPSDLAFDEIEGLFIVDEFRAALFNKEIATGTTRIISSGGVGKGTGFATDLINLSGVDLDKSRNRLYVAESTGSVIAVDLASSNRTTIIGPHSGEVGFHGINDMVFDQSEDTVFTINDKAIISVDPDTGERVITSGPSIDGTPLESASSVAIDTDRERFLVTEFAHDNQALFAVDKATGVREILSDSITGSGPNFQSPSGSVISANGEFAFITDYGHSDELFSVDLNNGERRVISSDSIGAGINFSTPNDVVASNEAEKLYVSDRDLRAIIKVDVLTGNRHIISGPDVGNGPSLIWPTRMSFDKDSNLIYLVDTGHSAVFVLNPLTGDRVMISK